MKREPMGFSTSVVDSDSLKTEQKIVAKIVIVFLVMSILYVLVIVFKNRFDEIFESLHRNEQYLKLDSGLPSGHSPQPGLMKMLSKGIKYDYAGTFFMNSVCIPGFVIAGYRFSKTNPVGFRYVISDFLIANLVISFAMAISAVFYKILFRPASGFTFIPYTSASWWYLALAFRFMAVLPFTFLAYWIGWKIIQKSGRGKSLTPGIIPAGAEG